MNVKMMGTPIVRAPVFVLVFLSLVSAGADGATPIKVRPANFYESVTSNNAPVCATVLKSLNKEYSFPLVSETASDSARYAGKVLLTTDLAVDWHHLPDDIAYMDFAKVDFQNNGKPVMIYRVRDSLGGQVFDVVGPSPYDPGDLASYSSKEPKRATESYAHIFLTPGPKMNPDVYTTTPQWQASKDKPSHIGSATQMYIDVIVAAGKSYMLATSAFNADRYYQYDPRNRVDVYLLQYLDSDHIPMICHFRDRKHLGLIFRSVP